MLVPLIRGGSEESVGPVATADLLGLGPGRGVPAPPSIISSSSNLISVTQPGTGLNDVSLLIFRISKSFSRILIALGF
jgi:hypothetical protein